MPLSDQYPLAVSFLTAPRMQKDGEERVVPIGTAFIINVPGRNVSHEYLVTARHVVEGESVAARFRSRAGMDRVPGVDLWKDVPMPTWFEHPTADVAIAPLPEDEQGELHRMHIPAAALVAAKRGTASGPELGDRVYFLGLLSLPGYPEMGEANVPMVRGGAVGALYQPGVPVRAKETLRRLPVAHLIDCRSYAGFSGSPVFFQRDNVLRADAMGATGLQALGQPGPFEDRGTQTLMLGLVSGHFDAWEKSDVTGDVFGEIKTKINAGVGVVTPVDSILEVLGMDEAHEQRERTEAEAAP